MRKSYSILEALIDTGNLRVMDPGKYFLEKISTIAQKSGDSSKLSHADLSVLALACELRKALISDDYAVQNIARLLNIPVRTISTKGIKEARKWISFCSACGKAYRPNITECLICGNKLRRRFKRQR